MISVQNTSEVIPEKKGGSKPGEGEMPKRMHYYWGQWGSVPLSNSGRHCWVILRVFPTLGVRRKEAMMFIHYFPIYYWLRFAARGITSPGHLFSGYALLAKCHIRDIIKALRQRVTGVLSTQPPSSCRDISGVIKKSRTTI